MISRVNRRMIAGIAGIFTSIVGASTFAFAANETSVSARVATEEMAPPYAVEDFAYPNAENIRAEKGITLLRGDGHIVLADCEDSADQIRVWTRVSEEHMFCFRVLSSTGTLTLEVPDVYALQTSDHPISADLTTGDTTETVAVAPDVLEAVGEGTGGDPTVLVELRVTG